MRRKTNAFLSSVLAVVLGFSAVLTGCTTSAYQESPGTSGGSASVMETPGVKAADDYYAAVNADVLKQHDTEENDGNWNWFYDLLDQSYGRQKEIIQTAASDVQREKAKQGTPEYKLGSLYLLASDTKGHNEDGLAYFNELMKPVTDAGSVAELMDALAGLRYHYGFDVLINANVLALDESAGEYTAQIDPLNYFVDAAEFAYNEKEDINDRKAYFTGYLTALLTASGMQKSEAEAKTETAWTFVENVAGSAEDSADYKKITFKELQTVLSNVDLARYISRIYKTAPKEFNVKETASLAKLNEYLTDENLQLLKDYVYMINLKNCAGYMGGAMLEAVKGAEITYIGDDPMEDMEKTGVNQVAELLKWDMGKLYTEKNFTAEEEAAVQNMVKTLLSEYGAMIREKDWLSQSTREKALLKLEKLNVRIGMPENIGGYLSAYVPVPSEDGGCYLSNVMQIRRDESERKYDNYGTPVNRSRWNIVPQELTPCYYPTDNSIYIPVAALKAPFFSMNASEEENLGAIGTIIGHEITHAFDDLGRMYDEKGDYVNWWTDADVKAFEERARKIVNYYSGYRTSDAMPADGAQTLGENIADLGSVHCLVRVVEKKGLDAKKFFESYANLWAGITDDISAAMMSGMDEHAPDKVRVNAVLSSCGLFYKTYEIKEGDGMYVDPENRVELW